MENFIFYNPTKLFFGKNVVEKNLGVEASKYGTKALLLIGKGSVKENGILEEVTQQLSKNNIQFHIFEGIKSNPIYEDADKAVLRAKEIKAEMIIAVGGGSVLDTAKAVAAGFYYENSIWDFYVGKAKAKRALPLLTILTLAATGSEMNPYTVLQNDETKQKFGYGADCLYPKVSFLDPSYTYSVNQYYTACGVADLISHTLEEFFDTSVSVLSDTIGANIIRLAFDYGKKAVEHPYDYVARANVMWLATMALNGSLAAGKKGGDWGVHALEHSLSALFDIAHGAGLAIIYPAWLKHFRPKIEDKLKFLSKHILGDENLDFIQALEKFYLSIDLPVLLHQANIEDKEKILINWQETRASGYFFKMENKDYESILKLI
jgi:alcohol dehydrogenase YqhD (iron-dependent ADH family)